jgi:hypothetical protein
MNIKIAYIIIGILLVSIISLSIYIAIRKPVCDHMHFTDNLSPWGEKDVVPDEETAMKIADAIVAGHPRFIPELEYYSIIIFNEQYNTWEIIYGAHGFLGGDVVIQIKKDSGMVIWNQNVLMSVEEADRILNSQ